VPLRWQNRKRTVNGRNRTKNELEANWQNQKKLATSGESPKTDEKRFQGLPPSPPNSAPLRLAERVGFRSSLGLRFHLGPKTESHPLRHTFCAEMLEILRIPRRA